MLTANFAECFYNENIMQNADKKNYFNPIKPIYELFRLKSNVFKCENFANKGFKFTE